MAAKWRAAVTARFTRVDCRERIISALGGFIGIFAVLAISGWVLDEHGAAWVAASMGATSVLLFAVPHGQLSQPWPVLGGQVLSALVGVTCAKLIAVPVVAAAVAVAAAIFVMYHLRCIHPPGGATALAAVLGGEQVRALGYGFAVTPVLANVLVLLAVAVAINWPFAWRRYPTALARRPRRDEPRPDLQVERGDLEFALRRINSFIDVSEQDLTRILELAYGHARERELGGADPVAGAFYSNGRFGDGWQVRKVLHAEPGRRVRYRIVAGEGRGTRGDCPHEEFAHWARHRVVRSESTWRLAPQPVCD